MSTKGPRKTQVEIQIHPSDIQRGVKYLFLGRAQAVGIVAVVLVWLALLIIGAVLAPSVAGAWLRRQELASLEETRGKLGERMIALRGRLEHLGDRTEQLNMRINKIYLAYGLENDESIGQGGYPEVAAANLDAPVEWLDQVQQAGEAEARLRERVRVVDAFLEEIQSFEQAHQGQVTSTPSMSPVRGEFRLTSPFGMRRSPFTKKSDFHAGIDVSAHEGTLIYAPADGRVSFAGRYPLRQSVAWWRYGNMVSLRHGDRFITLYGHMEDVEVKTGQRVKQGELLGTVGNTGWSTAPHLHYEVRLLSEDGQFQPVDPRIYMLDHRWSDEEQLLVRGRQAPAQDFEPLPRLIQR